MEFVPDQTPPDDRADPDEDDDSTGEITEKAGLAEESTDEHRAAKRGFFPSSMGLSFLVPEAARKLEVTVSWGDHAAEELPPAKPGDDARSVWRRTPRRGRLTLSLGPTNDERIPLPDAGGLELHRVLGGPVTLSPSCWLPPSAASGSRPSRTTTARARSSRSPSG